MKQKTARRILRKNEHLVQREGIECLPRKLQRQIAEAEKITGTPIKHLRRGILFRIFK